MSAKNRDESFLGVSQKYWLTHINGQSAIFDRNFTQQITANGNLTLKFKAFPAPRPSFERWRRGEKTRGSEPVLDLHICYCWKAATRKLSRPMIYLRLPPLGRVYREWICEFQAQSMQKKVYILFKILVFEHPWISTFTSLFYIETKATFYWREYVWWLF